MVHQRVEIEEVTDVDVGVTELVVDGVGAVGTVFFRLVDL